MSEYKYYLDESSDVVCAFLIDGSQDEYITDDMKPITEDEADILRQPKLTPEQQVEQAEQQKQYLIAEASQKTQLWQTQLILGIITEEDKASLKEWMLYVQEVQAVDPSPGAAVVWPIPPVSPAR